MTSFLQDLRYAIRGLRRTAALSLVIVASLAVGIGANTAIFSVVNALLLEPLPYPDPGRLVVLWLRSPGINIPQDWPSTGQFIDVRTENRSFDEMSISQGRSGTLVGRARNCLSRRAFPVCMPRLFPPARAANHHADLAVRATSAGRAARRAR